MVNQVSSASVSIYKAGIFKSADTKKQDKKDASLDSAYQLSLSDESRAVSGSGPLSSDEIEKLKNQADSTTASLRDLVEKLITGQSSGSSGSSAYSVSMEILGSSGNVTMPQTEAQTAVSDTGDWGVEAVSDRIVEFAKSVSGGDTSKLETLKAAIDKGFASAKRTLGGTLPDVSSKTYDAVMKKLDSWATGTETTTE